MTQELSVPQENELTSIQLEANSRLKTIEEHLQSIRNVLTFFTVLTVLALVFQLVAVLFGAP